MTQSEPMDSTGQSIKVGDKVRHRGKVLTIREIVPLNPRMNTLRFEESPVEALEIEIDLIQPEEKA